MKKGNWTMAKKIMDRRASDNKYLHRDFHISMKMALDYCYKKYGEEGLQEYLHTFASRCFSPLNERVKQSGLMPLKQYIEDIYGIEEAQVHTEIDGVTLKVSVPKSPAIAYIKEKGENIPDFYIYTTTIIYEEICRETGVNFYLDEYDNNTGQCEMRFVKAACL
jgi:hypothetical protein